MVQPVEIGNIALAGISAALVVFFGACYAMCYALAMLQGERPRLRRMLMAWAHVGYLALALCVALLAYALHLGGGWLLLVATILLGYWFAPRAIWRLSVAVHEEEGGGA